MHREYDADMLSKLLILAMFLFADRAIAADKRTIACKTPAIASSCYTTHGRLYVSNGRMNWRLWRIGTNRILGIYSGPEAFRHRYENNDSEAPELPLKLEKPFDVGDLYSVEVFADFEVCPLEPSIPAHMQAACIESVSHIIVRR
jgi:hypothetical protein